MVIVIIVVTMIKDVIYIYISNKRETSKRGVLWVSEWRGGGAGRIPHFSLHTQNNIEAACQFGQTPRQTGDKMIACPRVTERETYPRPGSRALLLAPLSFTLVMAT